MSKSSKVMKGSVIHTFNRYNLHIIKIVWGFEAMNVLTEYEWVCFFQSVRESNMYYWGHADNANKKFWKKIKNWIFKNDPRSESESD